MSNLKNVLINLSFSINSGPGTFALILGSGISQGAGIPTGWDIVLDLIRKIAILEKEHDLENPELWFKEKYQQNPNYSFLIDRIASSQSDRRNLLKRYIEPTDEDTISGLKVPSQSHKAIAHLVKNGFIRMILTTNIDQLLETALKELGVNPSIIFNDDSLQGAMPYVHSECTLIKLHGDYLDTRIKNTSDELAQYTEEMNSFLNRIFDDFGLIICGWSAKWDIALRDALYKRKNRRFSTYWAYPHDLSEEASNLINHLRAISFKIDNADNFFQKISDNIEALQAFERPHPLSIPLAIAQVKKYVADGKYHILLHDYLQDDINRLCDQLISDRFNIKDLKIHNEKIKDIFQDWMHEYEELVKLSIGIFSTYVFFGINESSKQVVALIERLLKIPFHDGDHYFIYLQYYPAYLLKYSICIAALDAENYSTLLSVFTSPQYRGYERQHSSLEFLNSWNVFYGEAYKFVPTSRNNPYTPISDYLCKFLFEELKFLIPDKNKFEEIFNVFEYLNGLMYVDQKFEDLTDKNLEGPYGRFKWKYNRDFKRLGINSPIDDFFKRGNTLGNNWEFIKVGFFNGSINRLNECRSAYEKYLETVGQHWI